MKKKKQNKESITHGIYRYEAGAQVFCRNTNKVLPIPLKFKKLLTRKYFKWWVRIHTVGIHRDVKFFADMPIEFVINHIPELHLMVISIRHPTDQFKRKSGVRIVKQRMDWALEHPKEDRNWKQKYN